MTSREDNNKRCLDYYHKNREKIIKKRKAYYKNNPWIRLFWKLTERCEKPYYKQFKDYGGRGIKNLFKDCNEIKFLMERDGYFNMKQPSIDRIDKNGHYCIENCQFIEMEENRIKDRIRPILQFTLDGKFIKEWKNIAEICRELNVHDSNVTKCIKGQRNQTGGFKWFLKK